jgi:hypothetical protein
MTFKSSTSKIYLNKEPLFIENTSGISNSNAIIKGNLLTSNRSYTLPNKSGTLAMLDDIVSGENTTAGNGLTMNGTIVELGGNLTKPTTIWGNKLDLITPTYDLNDAGLYLHKNGNFFQALLTNTNPILSWNTVNGTVFNVNESDIYFTNGSAGDASFQVDNSGLSVDSNQGMQFRAQQSQLYWNGGSNGGVFQATNSQLAHTLLSGELFAYYGGNFSINVGDSGGLQWQDTNNFSQFAASNGQLYYSADSGSNFLQLTSGGLNLKTSGTATIQVDGSNGLEYAFDYSVNYTNRSLVDKEYIDNQILINTTYGSNGISKIGNIFELGNTLYKDTTINGSNFDIKLYSDNFFIKSNSVKLSSNNSGSHGIIINNNSFTNDRTYTFRDYSGIVDTISKPIIAQNITGSVTVDLSLGEVFEFTLTGNVTNFTFINEVVGTQYMFYFIKTASNKTLTWATGKYRFPFGNAPILTDPTTNGSSPIKSVDIISTMCAVVGRLDVVYTPDLLEN